VKQALTDDYFEHLFIFIVLQVLIIFEDFGFYWFEYANGMTKEKR
jgi:hypothetical protein